MTPVGICVTLSLRRPLAGISRPGVWEYRMSWMVPAVIATLVDTFVLLAVYFYIYLQYRERFMAVWTLAWAVYAARLGLELSMLFTAESRIFLTASQVSSIASGLLLLWGVYILIGRPFPKIWIFAAGAAAVLVVSGGLAGSSFKYITLPTFLLTAAIFIWTGIVFIRSGGLNKSGRYITGWTFIIWGAHKLNYPFLRPIERLAPWGYLLAALLEITVAIGMLLIYYQKARKDLSESNELAKGMFQNNHAVMLLMDPETGGIVDANPAACVFYGLSREELLTLNITDINMLPRSRAVVEMQKARMERRNHFYYRHRLASGEVRDVEVFSGPIRASGRVLLYSIVHDITSRRQAEERLHTAMIKLSALIENMRDGILFEDKNRRIALVNQAFCGMFGIFAQAESILGADSRGAVLQAASLFADPAAFVRRIEEIVAREREVTDEQIPLADGRLFERDYAPIYSHGAYLGHLWQYRDVTARKVLQDQLRHAQKMEAIGTLAGGVAHDFNNIITAVVGYGTLLRMAVDSDQRARGYVDQILSASERASALTKGLLAFSRKQQVTLRPVNIGEIIQRVMNLLRRLITEDIELSTDIKTDGMIVMADYVQIEQLLMNLTTNARDAMPSGGRLTIKTGRTALDSEFRRTHGFGKAGNYAFISVSDTGIGMDERTIERIFEPFFTTKEMGRGTGLGLAVVYGVVKQHNGYIICESRPGGGTTFTIYIPIVDLDASTHDQPALFLPPHGNETLLVAEDDSVVRALTRTLLEEFGYHVIEAVDGEDAIDKYREHNNEIRLVIMDAVMPKKNGREAFEEIRRIYPGARVLFMSGYAADTLDAKGILDNGLDFILKPISPAELLKKVREVLER